MKENTTTTVTYDELKDIYNDRILEYMERTSAVLCANGWNVEGPSECSDEEWGWDMLAYLIGDIREHAYSIRVTIVHSGVAGDDPEDGVAFSLGIVACDGRIVGGHTPLNYTNKVWVPYDKEAIELRFGMLLAAPVSGIWELLEEDYLEHISMTTKEFGAMLDACEKERDSTIYTRMALKRYENLSEVARRDLLINALAEDYEKQHEEQCFEYLVIEAKKAGIIRKED
jgi:hypothetical protein